MARKGGEGSGWWRQSRRHHDAALKGTHGKRTHHSRGKERTNKPQITEEKLEGLRRSYKRNHSAWSVSMDQIRSSKNLLDPSDPAQVKKWKKNTGRADLDGVDTAAQTLYRIKLKVLPKVEIKRKAVEKAVRKAHKRAVELKTRAKTGEDTSEALKTAVNEAKEALALAGKEVKALITGAKEEQHKAIRKYQGKWSEERHKRAELVSKTVGCSIFEADALISRASRAGVDYDLVDWDAIQGSDLEFSERVEKLNHNLHKETMSKGEEEKHLDWQLNKYEEQFDDFMAEQEARLQEEFGGDPDAMRKNDEDRERRREEARGEREDPYAYA